jgi:hypothetical protein
MDKETEAYYRKRYPWWDAESKAARAYIKREWRGIPAVKKEAAYQAVCQLWMIHAHARWESDWKVWNELETLIRKTYEARFANRPPAE